MNEAVKKEEQEYELQYYVVMNHEEQYSIWPTYKPIPRGWHSVGEARNKEKCLKYIDEVWTDMRPLSLRRQMEELGMEYKTQKNSRKTYDAKPVQVIAKKVTKKEEAKVDKEKKSNTPKKQSVSKTKSVKSGKKSNKR